MNARDGFEPEFSRIVDIRHITDEAIVLKPDEAERRRLAGRFGLSAIETMQAEISLAHDGEAIVAKGRLNADIVQACAISGEDFPVRINEPVALRFIPASATATYGPDEEVEITADACDEIEYDGLAFDLGEAVAQTLALAIDPFAEGPDADQARAKHKLAGDPESGSFAALAALKKHD